ncbi:hypothetical protein [Microbulbifer yueqingensis]|uniref:Uncharacterized protein n=1 Tax=Microbulbifer yueqingensis TaxID=658219 RepID=A0A1G9CTC5_9GAMM|nr:hypothetical protein [Microbulbifer yueqingensis]SDK54896.1 hypothetical protein SAMN05216212_2618 [Microbulbifer yueqingensis]
MQRPARKLLLSGLGCVYLAGAGLVLPACTSDGYVRSSSPSSGNARYRVSDPYYHCHRGGACHSVRHTDDYWSSEVYRQFPKREDRRKPRPL